MNLICSYPLASFPVSTPSFFLHVVFFTTCAKKLGVETGYRFGDFFGNNRCMHKKRIVWGREGG